MSVRAVPGSAVAAQLTRDPRGYGAAVARTLPAGLVATVGVHLVHGLV